MLGDFDFVKVQSIFQGSEYTSIRYSYSEKIFHKTFTKHLKEFLFQKSYPSQKIILILDFYKQQSHKQQLQAEFIFCLASDTTGKSFNSSPKTKTLKV